MSIFSAGTEVAIALAARDRLQAQGIPTRVVSAPCFELFERQDTGYRHEVIGEAPVRIAVEAGVRQGWDRFIGENGFFYGMTGFGTSAPYETLYEKFGLTADHIVSGAYVLSVVFGTPPLPLT